MEVGTLTLTDGGTIISSTEDAGQGGNVTVVARDTITIAGRNSGLRTTAASSGKAVRLP